VAYFASTLVVGWMLTWLIEWPFLQLRDRLVASPTRKPLAPIEEISTAARAEVA